MLDILLPLKFHAAILPPLSKAFEPVIWPFDFNIKLSSVSFIWADDNSNPPIVPPVNKTFEPVICPLSFSCKTEPTETLFAEISIPPIAPPVKSSAEAVTSPLAFTLKFVDDINLLLPVAEPLIKKFAEDKASSVISNPPMVPSFAVTFPLMITLPSLSRWKLDELISMLPFEPLTNWDKLPKKNLGVCIFTELPLSVVSPVLNILMLPLEPLIKLVVPPSPNAEELILVVVPSNFMWLPFESPIRAAGELPLKNIPLFVPSIPVGRGLPADMNPPSLELINKLLALNLYTSTSISATEAVTTKLSDLILTPDASACINEPALPTANLNSPSVSIPTLKPPAKSPLLNVEPLPIAMILSALLIVIALWPAPAVNEPALIWNPPTSPLVALIVPPKSILLAVILPSWSTLNWLELINKSSVEFPSVTPVVDIVVSAISKPPIVPPVALTSPDMVTLPSGLNSKLEDDICRLPFEPLIKFVGPDSLPKKNVDVLISNTDGLVLNLKKLSLEPVVPSCISKPAPS